MSGHTPGPWTVREARGLLLGGSESADLPLHDPEREANARLIAASPDLLAALVEAAPLLEELIEEGGGDDHSVGLCDCRDRATLAAMKDAISKATGGQS